MLLTSSESLFDDRIGTLADDQDLPFRSANHHGHSLTCRIELDQVKKLILADTVPSITDHVVVLISFTEEESQMSSTIHESELIWTRGVIDDVLLALLSLLVVRDDCMAESQSFMESLQVLAILMASIVHVVIELLIFKVDIGYTRWVLVRLWIILSIFKLTSGESLELHDILGERASLITENIMDHT